MVRGKIQGTSEEEEKPSLRQSIFLWVELDTSGLRSTPSLHITPSIGNGITGWTSSAEPSLISSRSVGVDLTAHSSLIGWLWDRFFHPRLGDNSLTPYPVDQGQFKTFNMQKAPSLRIGPCNQLYHFLHRIQRIFHGTDSDGLSCKYEAANEEIQLSLWK